MVMKSSVYFLLGISLALVSTEAEAQDTCAPFSVFVDRSTEQITFIDTGEEGPSVGDRRFYAADLISEAGDVIGSFDGEASLIHPDDDGNTRTISNSNLQFATGVILYQVSPAGAVRQFNDTSATVNSEGAARIILGGSGVFSGASGTLDMVHGEDRIELIIDVSCR